MHETMNKVRKRSWVSLGLSDIWRRDVESSLDGAITEYKMS